jgi:hypothetical protein
MGRSMESNRGLFEFLPSILSAERHDSALSLAIAAAATKNWRLWCGGGVNVGDEPLSKALARLQKAIADPSERTSRGTILAALLLQFYENMSAVFSRRKANRTHRDGALAILSQQTLDDINSLYRGHILGYFLHTEVSLCIIEKRPFPVSATTWLESGAAATIPVYPSSILDTIGVSVANLQYIFARLSSSEKHRPASSKHSRRWRNKIIRTDEQLKEWQRTVPDHWRPRRLESGKDMDLAIATFSGTCDVYPSIQVATIWGVWRTYRLIILKIKLGLLQDFSPDRIPEEKELENWNNDLERNLCIQDVKELVDAISRSVPFYLGNRTKPSSLSDLTDSQIIFPSYHDLASGDEAVNRYQSSDYYMSRDDHHRHAIVQGPWHILGPLTHLMSLFSDREASPLTEVPQQAQVDWIREQFWRAIYLLHLEPTMGITSSGEGPTHRYQPAHRPTATALVKTEIVARRTREGMRMTGV